MSGQTRATGKEAALCDSAQTTQGWFKVYGWPEHASVAQRLAPWPLPGPQRVPGLRIKKGQAGGDISPPLVTHGSGTPAPTMCLCTGRSQWISLSWSCLVGF